MKKPQISERELRILNLLQFAYRNIGVLNPDKLYAEAETLSVKKFEADYLLNHSNLLVSEKIGSLYIYKWNFKLASTNIDIIPNVHMVRAMISGIAARKERVCAKKDAEQVVINKLAIPGIKSVAGVKCDRLVLYVYKNTTDWTPAAVLNIQEIVSEIRISRGVFSTMIKIGILLTEGTTKQMKYKWNPSVKYCPELIIELMKQSALYSAKGADSVTKFYPHTEDNSVTDPEFKNIDIDTKTVESCIEMSKINLSSNEKQDIPAETKSEEDRIIKEKRKIKRWRWTDDEEWAVIQGMVEGMPVKDIATILGREYGSTMCKITELKKNGKLIILPSGRFCTVAEPKKDDVENYADFAQEVKKECEQLEVTPVKNVSFVKRMFNKLLGIK